MEIVKGNSDDVGAALKYYDLIRYGTTPFSENSIERFALSSNLYTAVLYVGFYIPNATARMYDIPKTVKTRFLPSKNITLAPVILIISFCPILVMKERTAKLIITNNTMPIWFSSFSLVVPKP